MEAQQLEKNIAELNNIASHIHQENDLEQALVQLRKALAIYAELKQRLNSDDQLQAKLVKPDGTLAEFDWCLEEKP